jgi:uncharacterized membrane-anchored protein
MMKFVLAILAAVVSTWISLPAIAQQPKELPPAIVEIVKSLKPQRGKIAIPAAKASLDLGQNYDFYSAEDTRKILVSIWGNPPQSAEHALGMVMPAGASPVSDAWGAVITFEETGYVADDDAADVDYAEMLTQMRDAEGEANAERTQQGYPTIHIAGWAEQPRYDKATHSVVWARDLQFSGDSVHTLNYDVRTLGRTGVLSLNLVSNMPKLNEVRGAARAFAAHAAFDPGARYEDFDASVDRKAEYGIGGLVAAGTGLAVAKKLGFFALLAKFIKPIAIGVLVLFAAMRKRIAGLFGRSEDV